MIWLYRLLSLPALLLLPVAILLVPRNFRRTFGRGNFIKDFSQRLGAAPRLGPPKAGTVRIWIHAVSVGEILGIAPLIDRLTARRGVEVYVTTTTTTGRAIGLDRFGRRVLGVGYFPLDFWPCSAWAWRRIHPTLALIMEREIWLEHLHQAGRRGVPVVMVNARMSDHSFRWFSRFRAVIAPTMARFAQVLASSPADAHCFRVLGCLPDRLETTGNLKLDAEIGPVLDEAARRALRAELGLGDELVLMGSSTWPGEEEALLEVWRGVREAGIACRLLLVPRHGERRNELAAWLARQGATWHLRSTGPVPGPVDILVADTTGEMVRLLQAADVVFIGRSLPPNEGGQTPIEAAALGRPLLFGPMMSNFREISRQLVDAGAATVVPDASALAAEVLRLCREPATREAMGRAALSWHQRNRGSVDRTLVALERFFTGSAVAPRTDVE